MLRVTFVAAAPPAICVGMHEQVLSVGRPEAAHEYVTALVNVEAPIGEKLSP